MEYVTKIDLEAQSDLIQHLGRLEESLSYSPHRSSSTDLVETPTSPTILPHCRSLTKEELVAHLEPAFQSMSQTDVCSICLNKLYKQLVRQLPCQHQFHDGCIDHWLDLDEEMSCPLCRYHCYPIEASTEN